MNDFKSTVLKEFQKLATSSNSTLIIAETFCEFSRNGITLRARWSVERIAGVFVTLAMGTKEYGLPYLVEFRGGTTTELAAASSDNPKATANLVRKYALPFLEAIAHDFPAFIEFAERRISKNVPPS
jgi:hypothetical protein